MKRFFLIAAAAVLGIMTFSSCNGNAGEFGYAVITAEYHINDALNSIADVTMNLTKMDGSKQSYPVSTTFSNIDIDKYSKNLPVRFNYTFNAVATGKATKPSYDVELTYKFTVKVYNTDGKLVKSDSVNETVKNSVKADGLVEVLNYFNKTLSGKLEIASDMSISK